MKYPIRSQFRAPAGKSLISIDLSAAESWIVAHLCDDANMKHELQFGDLHSYTARIIFSKGPNDIIDPLNERYPAKKVNHGSSYRMGASVMTDGINKEGKITVSLQQVKRWHERWHETFSVRLWWERLDNQLLRNRTLVTTYGRSRTFYGFLNDKLKREATAFEPQSTVADHMRGKIHKELNIPGGILACQKNIFSKTDDILLLANGHDSMLVECPTNIIKEIAEQCISYIRRPLIVNGQEFTIPVDCDVYPERWGEEGYKLT
jgi:DNA polymerase I-like protein with 3'-5' exonuclease and polymerase domains